MSGFRVWSDAANGGNGGWYDLNGVSINLNAWNTLGISLSGTGYDFFVNGQDVLNTIAATGTTSYGSVLMQAFNFDGNTNSPGAVISPYTAHWANVPEPGTLALMGLSLAVLGAMSRKRI